MKIALCDDDRQSTALIEGYIKKWASTKNIPVEISIYHSAEDFLFHFSPAEYYDLLFLEVKMGPMSGITLAHTLRNMGQNLPIVFVTGISDYVFEGYNVGALNYLMKPITTEDCEKCLDRVYGQLNHPNANTLLVPLNGNMQIVNLSDILYIESFNHNLVLHMCDSKANISYRKNISIVENDLPSDYFIRIHRSYIINLRHMVKFNKKEVEMKSGEIIPISRERRQMVYDILIKNTIS